MNIIEIIQALQKGAAIRQMRYNWAVKLGTAKRESNGLMAVPNVTKQPWRSDVPNVLCYTVVIPLQCTPAINEHSPE